MGNTIESYRAAIGAFYSVTHKFLGRRSPEYQSGFLPGHSTVHHLIELMHNVCISLEQYETNCQIFCDISKAFDRVWHRGLLHKLEKYGIKGDLLFWLTSYLNSRKQKVFINGVLSN